jgi:hypothetical protein
MPSEQSHIYTELAATGPYEAKIGSALITMVEPHVGHERAYNRWYEDDHFNSGAMAMPWMFAGRRWVAPKPLQALRYPADSAIAKPVDAGKYISIYWVTDGRYDDHMGWSLGTNKRLRADSRIHMERTHVYTSFQAYRGASYRDASGPRDIHALDYPFGGLVVEVVDAPSSAGREKLIDWLKAERVPSALSGTDTMMCLYFQPMPLPADKMPYVKDVEGVDNRLTLLWFTEGDPTESWDRIFSRSGDLVAKSGLGRVELVAPFIPTLPGTDKYVDELR